MSEILWKDIYIDGILSQYKVSSDGQVKNSISDIILKPFKNTNGYLVLTLYLKNKKHLKRINVLVAQAFIDNPLNKPTVNHIDGNKENNRVDNLEWSTHHEQNLHAFKMGLMKARKGEESHYCKHSESTIHEICKLLEKGLNRVEVSKLLNVSTSLIKHIIRKNSWVHVSSQYNINVETTRADIRRGEGSNFNKYPEELIRKICILLEQGLTVNEVNKELKLDNKGLVRDIYRKKRWKHISSQYNFNDKVEGSTTIEDYYVIDIT